MWNNDMILGWLLDRFREGVATRSHVASLSFEILVTWLKQRSCDLFGQMRSGSTFMILPFINFAELTSAPHFCNSNDTEVTSMFIIGLQIVCYIKDLVVAFQYTIVTGVLSIIYVFLRGSKIWGLVQLKYMRCLKRYTAYDNYWVIFIGEFTRRWRFVLTFYRRTFA